MIHEEFNDDKENKIFQADVKDFKDVFDLIYYKNEYRDLSSINCKTIDNDDMIGKVNYNSKVTDNIKQQALNKAYIEYHKALLHDFKEVKNKILKHNLKFVDSLIEKENEKLKELNNKQKELESDK